MDFRKKDNCTAQSAFNDSPWLAIINNSSDCKYLRSSPVHQTFHIRNSTSNGILRKQASTPLWAFTMAIVLMIGMHYCLVCKIKYSTTNQLVVRMTANLFKWMFSKVSRRYFHLGSFSGTGWSQRWSSVMSYSLKHIGWTSSKKKEYSGSSYDQRKKNCNWIKYIYAACFRAKHSTVFFYVRAAHYLVFSVSLRSP